MLAMLPNCKSDDPAQASARNASATTLHRTRPCTASPTGCRLSGGGTSPTDDEEEIVTEALRDLARWLYRRLQVEYDDLTSDEVIEEEIIVNEYTFTEAGRRLG